MPFLLVMRSVHDPEGRGLRAHPIKVTGKKGKKGARREEVYLTSCFYWLITKGKEMVIRGGYLRGGTLMPQHKGDEKRKRLYSWCDGGKGQ